MMKFAARFFVLSAVVLGVAGCSTAPVKPAAIARSDYGYTKEYIQWLARTEMKKHDVTGLSIALVDDQRIVWAEGFGLADQENKIPASPETIYRAGSISKLFTATVAMQLAEQGKFDIDKPLQTYLPDFSIRRRFEDVAPITPRNLMTHHSGLPSDYIKGMWTRRAEPYATLLTPVRDEYAVQPPNTIFSYSNLGVTLLGLAEERVAGQDFAAFVQTSLLEPLGMARSSFAKGPDKSAGAAKAYVKGDLGEEPELRNLPAGGLNSTVLDLSRLMQMVFSDGMSNGRRIISSASLGEMLRPQNSGIPLDLNFHVGLGWMLSGLGDIDIKNAGPVAHHSGATLYHRSMLAMLPDKKLGVVVLANSATGGEVVNKLAAETLKLALEAKTGITQPEPIARVDDENSIPEQQLASYEGRYATIAGVVPVTKESGYLRAEVNGAPLRLVPGADGLLGLKFRLFGLFPISLGPLDRVGITKATINGHDILTARMDRQELLVGELIRPVPVSAAWQARVGEYEIVNKGDDVLLIDNIRLKNDNGLLVVEYGMPHFSAATLSFALKPLSDNEAIIYGLGRGMGETLRIAGAAGDEVIRFSGYILRKKAL
ncbi:protein flp [Geobacter sp. OR-1]|uniref:serine hydrolase domain-containing protein n=1 Tax=Geobacter sp. OR-1 TaxID=1266765 RepID=UPI000541CDCE|nr:serine hydrolase domain-containing protein [Geobacter sp. OR-1]GAM08635.1 protein flp [Geobacter sp. OR-1]